LSDLAGGGLVAGAALGSVVAAGFSAAAAGFSAAGFSVDAGSLA